MGVDPGWFKNRSSLWNTEILPFFEMQLDILRRHSNCRKQRKHIKNSRISCVPISAFYAMTRAKAFNRHCTSKFFGHESL